MSTPTKISYAFIVLLLLLVCALHLATPFVTVLFSYFALNTLRLRRSKPIAVVLFLMLVTALGFGSYYFAKLAYVAIPKIATTTIPVVIEFAEQRGIDLPFTDYSSLKEKAVSAITTRVAGIGQYAKTVTFEIAAFLIGLVVAVSLFLDSRFPPRPRPLRPGDRTPQANLYVATWTEIAKRFRTFYASFSKVMGAQIVISLINTALTSMFLLWAGLPFASVIIVLTFLCGLLPIIGNLLSNTLIVGVALTVSPRLALAALVFLVLLHKLEYFLNSKIIGDRIKNPMWLTLLGLILGERLMGIPGMILAPVVLHYIKVEASRGKFASFRKAVFESPAPPLDKAV
ncbi:MAG: AI-2E family transporter [Verrucomicrobia bacterium]|nr:AI-2E family transporter [Verrucomicrobiota bacterium]